MIRPTCAGRIACDVDDSMRVPAWGAAGDQEAFADERFSRQTTAHLLFTFAAAAARNSPDPIAIISVGPYMIISSVFALSHGYRHV